MTEQMYTIARRDGEDREEGLTLDLAAFMILTHDSAQYQILQNDDDGSWAIWRKELHDRDFNKTIFVSRRLDKLDAIHEMCQAVVDWSMGVDVPGLVARRQDEYDAEIAACDIDKKTKHTAYREHIMTLVSTLLRRRSRTLRKQ
jgi:hypothetical protein